VLLDWLNAGYPLFVAVCAANFCLLIRTSQIRSEGLMVMSRSVYFRKW